MSRLLGAHLVNFSMLVSARACQGAFAAILVPSALSLLTTTFTGPLQSSDGRNGTFTIVVHSATDLTPNTISSEVSGSLQVQGAVITVSGFFESLTGAMTFTGNEVPYRFSGAVSNGSLNASFTAPNSVTGVVTSTQTTVTSP